MNFISLSIITVDCNHEYNTFKMGFYYDTIFNLVIICIKYNFPYKDTAIINYVFFFYAFFHVFQKKIMHLCKTHIFLSFSFSLIAFALSSLTFKN